MRKKSIASCTTIASSIRKLSLSLLLAGCWLSPSLGADKKAEISSATVNEDRVTIRVRVTDEKDKPVMRLSETDFQLFVDGQPNKVNFDDWKSSEEATPPPAWIIVLLDMSGSMRASDSRGTTKIQGALEAIRKFTELAAERGGGNTQIAIVPFGDGAPKCEGYPVNKNTLDKFFPAGDFKLQNYLDFLQGLTPCASTNLYEPLERAIRFLGNTEDIRFHPSQEKDSQSSEPKPRLSIVLLSDGFHNKPNEKLDFENLKSLLEDNSKIIVHTLGYGSTPEQLKQKYKLPNLATRDNLWYGQGTPPQGKVLAEEFVDKDRLTEIAQPSGGIAEFSQDAETIAENLKLFLNALLGEYEITYTEPNPERGSSHKVKVSVDGVESAPKDYRIGVFGRSLPSPVRVTMLICTLLLAVFAGIVPFYFWGQKLKQEATED